MLAIRSLISGMDNLSMPLRLLIWSGLGAVAALGQAPWGIWPATVIALALAYELFSSARNPIKSAWIGWAFGTGYFMLALSWIIEPFLVDAVRHGWIAPFALIGLAGGLALFWAAGFALARLAGGGMLAWIASLTLVEATRGFVLTGFPWAQIGHVWIDTPVLHWSALVGSLGLTVLILLGGGALWLVGMRRWVLGGSGLILISVAWGGGPFLTRDVSVSQDRPVVRLIQPNAVQHEKWDPAKIPVFFDRQISYTRTGDRPDLIVWPETAVPVLLNNAGETLKVISDAAGDVPVVLGIQRRDGLRIYNSLAVLAADGDVTSVYDKHHLVPFGEYMPFGDFLARFGISGMAAQNGKGYSSGPGAQVIQIDGLGGALPLICYEGVFAQDVRAAPTRPDFMLLITNDAWFGEVSGPYQHLAQARLRSVEQGLPMIRVANTGVSAMIDPRGQVTAQIPLGQAGWTDAQLPAARPATVYSKTGDIPVLVLLVLMLGLSLQYNRGRQTAL